MRLVRYAVFVLWGLALAAPFAHAQIAFRAASQASVAAGAAAPTFQAAGAAVSGTGSVTPAWPAHAVNDVALLFCESAGGQPVTLSTPNGFAPVANSPQFTGAGAQGTRISVFWARATSTSMPAPVVADPGDHVYCQILTYRGVVTTGDPWDVTGGGFNNILSVTGVTTTVTNTRVVQVVAREDDSAAAAFSAQTNANLTGITERSDAGTTAGNGGGFAVWDGVMASAGATGATTVTVTSSPHAFLTVALRRSGAAAPTFQAAGAAVSGTGSVTPAWPAHAVNDVALLFCESAGGQPVTLSTPNGFAPVANSPQFTGAGAQGTRISVFWARATSTSMPAPVVADPGDHVYCQILTYRGVVTTGDPWDVTGGGVNTTITVTGVTTTMPNTLVVQAVTRDDDSAAAAFSAQTNANLTGITERSDAGTTAGNGGGFAVWDGVMASAGATGNTTATASPVLNAFLTIALRPPPSTLTIPVPAGTQPNDVMIASITYRPCSGTSGGACTTTITPPAGWTQVNSVTDQTTGAGTGGFGNRLFVYQRVATGAEPASYTWTFGGTLEHAGAAGGIISFSGVDTASPIVAEGGQATASSTSHAAPSINTGTVTNTMLVSSHSANSSAAWTPPAGMTERVDAASLAVPNDLGLAIEMNHELFAGSGATGARTAGWTAPPTADTGITHMLALRPAVVVPTPGSFNAFETSTPPGAITGVIRTRIAGSAFALDVVAIESGAQLNGFTDQVTVELLANNTLGIALDANNCPTTFTLVQTVTPNPTITGGRSTVSFAAVPNSWRDVRVRVRWPTASPTVTSCSTDNFAIRPSAFTGFSVSDTDWETAGTGRALNDVTFGAVTHKAGRPFSVRAQAVNSAAAATTNYAGTPSAVLSACAGAACTATFGTLSLGTTFAAGQLASDVASYSEVGSFSLQLVDDSFASVDAADGSTAAERNIVSTVINVGRFVPDHFAVSLNTPSFDAACAGGGFTYVGQPFGYAVQPQITVTARDFNNNTTQLYAGAWFRISNASLTGKSYTAATGTLDTGGITGADPVIAAAGSGMGTLTFGSGTGLLFARTTPVAPFDAEISLAINVIDEDGVAYAANPVRFGQASSGNGIAFNNGKTMRFGRLRIGNAHGSQLVPLQVPMEAQYWNGTAFVTNTADSCTALAANNVAMSNFTQNLEACETSLLLGAFSSGRAVAQLSAPGAANAGSVILTPNLGTSGSGSTCVAGTAVPVTGADRAYLQGSWGGGAWDQNPRARGTFGVYGGSGEVIFIRENF